MAHSPEITFSIEEEQLPVGLSDHKVLIVGQMLQGTATPLALYKEVKKEEINSLFGANSVLADMVREYFVINKINKLSVLPLQDKASSAVASASITFAGKATEDGTLTFYITKKAWGNSSQNREHTKFVLNIKKDEEDKALKVKLENAIKAVATKDASVLYAVATGSDDKKITISATNKGKVGNLYYIGFEGVVSGITITLTEFKGGSEYPDLTLEELQTAIGNNHYKTIIWQPCIDIKTIKDFLNSRYRLLYRDLSGVAITGDIDTFDNLLNSAKIVNDKLTVYASDKLVNKVNYKGGSLAVPAHILAVTLGAFRALKLTPSADISSFVTTSSLIMQQGGFAASTLPYFNNKCNNLALSHQEYNFTDEEMHELQEKGIAFFDYDNNTNSVVLGAVSTTTDLQKEVTFHYLEPLDIALLVREYFTNNFKQSFSQNTLVNGSRINDNQVDHTLLTDFNLKLYSNLVELGVLDPSETAKKEFIETMVIVIDTTGAISFKKTGVARPGHVSISFKVLPVGQLRSIEIAMLVK